MPTIRARMTSILGESESFAAAQKMDTEKQRKANIGKVVTYSFGKLPALLKMVKSSDSQIWFLATEELKNGGFKGYQVVWDTAKRVPDKAKSFTIAKLDIDQKYYAPVNKTAVDEKVIRRFNDKDSDALAQVA